MADEEHDDVDTPGGVPPQVQTICPQCGGSGAISDAKLAIIGGVPRLIDNGRPCPVCEDGRLPGIVPPV